MVVYLYICLKRHATVHCFPYFSRDITVRFCIPSSRHSLISFGSGVKAPSFSGQRRTKASSRGRSYLRSKSVTHKVSSQTTSPAWATGRSHKQAISGRCALSS